MRGEFLRRCLKSKLLVCGAIITLFVVLIAVVGTYIVPFDPIVQELANKFASPTWFLDGWSANPLGTDALGRDVLSRILAGCRYSIFVGLSAVIMSTLMGITMGLLSGYYGGWIDNLIMRLADVQMALPLMMIGMAIVAILGPNLRNLVIVMALISWPTFARVVRASVLGIKGSDFVAAARVSGASDLWIMVREILPNVFTPILVVSTQQVAHMILMETSFSFLGLGVQPPTPSWGVMIADGRAYITTAPWVSLAPGIALMITVMAINLFGDGLRDVLDPKLRRRA